MNARKSFILSLVLRVGQEEAEMKNVSWDVIPQLEQLGNSPTGATGEFPSCLSVGSRLEDLSSQNFVWTNHNVDE